MPDNLILIYDDQFAQLKKFSFFQIKILTNPG